MCRLLSTGCSANQKSAEQRALWVSTSTTTRGGIATFVRTMQHSALWDAWNIRHVSTHCDGSVAVRILRFIAGLVNFILQIVCWHPNIIHIHVSSNGSFARKSILAWISIPCGIPIIFHVHGSEFHHFYEKSPKLIRAFIRATLQRVDIVVALGDTWAARLRSIAPRASVIVVPNAINIMPIFERAPTTSVNVVFLGRISERKGAFVLIDSWSKVIQDLDVDAMLTIAGDGEIDRARVQVEALGIGETVNVRGWLPPNEVQRLLETAEIFVLPSLNEGQPMAILEAMERGLCVIASNAGGIPEMVDQECGILVEPGDVVGLAERLSEVISNSEQRYVFGVNARRRVELEFGLSRVSQILDECYRQLIACTVK